MRYFVNIQYGSNKLRLLQLNTTVFFVYILCRCSQHWMCYLWGLIIHFSSVFVLKTKILPLQYFPAHFLLCSPWWLLRNLDVRTWCRAIESFRYCILWHLCMKCTIHLSVNKQRNNILHRNKTKATQIANQTLFYHICLQYFGS